MSLASANRFPTVSILRRCSAALAALLLLQLSLLGSGTLCALQETQETASVRGTGMAGMPGMAAHQAASPSSAQHGSGAEHCSVPSSCDATRGTPDCGLPWSPAVCSAMTTCATVVAPSVVALTILDRAVPAADLPEPLQLRTGPADAPELPPPRA